MRADAHAIEKIFDTPIQYRVPLYQRPYVWERNVEDPSEDRLTPFWEDVRDTVARYLSRQEHLQNGVPEDDLAAFTDHFFGAVVLGKLDKNFGGIPHQEVIDGQQRFTTAQLLIAAAHRLAQQHDLGTTADVLRDLYLNPDKHEPQPDEQPKLWPTNANRVAYAVVMDPDGPGSTADDPNNRIQEAYAYFEGELRGWLEDIPSADRERQMKALHRVLRAHLKFVVIQLEEGDNAQEIFESLNAQGTPLLAIDLVKNHVFRRAANAKLDLTALDEKVWRELDDDWWREEQRQGRFSRPRAELFLMHWLTMRKRDEVPALGLFIEFQREVLPAVVPDSQIQSFVEGFIEDARLYRSFYSLPGGSLSRRFFDRLGVLDNTTLYPLMLRLFIAERDGELTATERNQALSALESWVVRRLICDYTPKSYNRTTVDLLKAIAASPERPHVAVTDFLRGATADTEIWPTNTLVLNALTQRPLYNRVKPVRRVKLLLEACELERRSASGGFAELAEEEAPQLGMSLTVEHVLPQSWSEHWPLARIDSMAPEEREHLEGEREARVHRLGNLTLVTKRLNPSIGNSAWPVKREALDTHSVLHLNRDLVQGNEISWEEAAMDGRGRELAELIVKHWPGPGE
jgi:Protein of unknown function DUF262/Protein of unknown function (DUF1524)